MAHFRCTPCRARMWRDPGIAEHLDDPCPSCGGPLEPVARAEELMGLQALAHTRSSPGTIADQVRAVIASHDAARAGTDDGDDAVSRRGASRSARPIFLEPI